MVLGYLGGWYFSRSPKQPAWDSARKRGRALTLNPKPWNPKTLNPKYINPEDFVPKAGKKSSALPALPGARLVALTVRRPYPHSPPLFPHTHPLHPHTPLPPSSLHTHTHPTPSPLPPPRKRDFSIKCDWNCNWQIRIWTRNFFVSKICHVFLSDMCFRMQILDDS